MLWVGGRWPCLGQAWDLSLAAGLISALGLVLRLEVWSGEQDKGETGEPGAQSRHEETLAGLSAAGRGGEAGPQPRGRAGPLPGRWASGRQSWDQNPGPYVPDVALGPRQPPWFPLSTVLGTTHWGRVGSNVTWPNGPVREFPHLLTGAGAGCWAGLWVPVRLGGPPAWGWALARGTRWCVSDGGWESGQPPLEWRVDASGWGSRATAFILPWRLPLEASGPGPSGGGEGVVYSAGGAGVRWASLGPAWPACAS